MQRSRFGWTVTDLFTAIPAGIAIIAVIALPVSAIVDDSAVSRAQAIAVLLGAGFVAVIALIRLVIVALCVAAVRRRRPGAVVLMVWRSDQLDAARVLLGGTGNPGGWFPTSIGPEGVELWRVSGRGPVLIVPWERVDGLRAGTTEPNPARWHGGTGRSWQRYRAIVVDAATNDNESVELPLSLRGTPASANRRLAMVTPFIERR